MFNAYPARVRLIEDLEGYIRVYDTADWRIVFTDVRDIAGQPLDLTGATLSLQIRPQLLPNCLVDDLYVGAGITVTPGADASHGPTLSIVSLATSRSWRARDGATLIADLMLARDGSSTLMTRVHLIASAGVTVL